METTAQFNWNQLPNEIKDNVIKYLDFPGAANLRATNKANASRVTENPEYEAICHAAALDSASKKGVAQEKAVLMGFIKGLPETLETWGTSKGGNVFSRLCDRALALRDEGDRATAISELLAHTHLLQNGEIRKTALERLYTGAANLGECRARVAPAVALAHKKNDLPSPALTDVCRKMLHGRATADQRALGLAGLAPCVDKIEGFSKFDFDLVAQETGPSNQALAYSGLLPTGSAEQWRDHVKSVFNFPDPQMRMQAAGSVIGALAHLDSWKDQREAAHDILNYVNGFAHERNGNDKDGAITAAIDGIAPRLSGLLDPVERTKWLWKLNDIAEKQRNSSSHIANLGTTASQARLIENLQNRAAYINRSERYVHETSWRLRSTEEDLAQWQSAAADVAAVRLAEMKPGDRLRGAVAFANDPEMKVRTPAEQQAIQLRRNQPRATTSTSARASTSHSL
jgi:hypothetical protein